MTAATAMPGNTANTFLVHFFGTGLADDRYVVERFRARADGGIVPAPAEKAGLTPGAFVRKATARAAADDLYLYGGGLTPELADLIHRTHRAVHLLTYVKREELAGSERGALFDRAAEDASAVQIGALGTDQSGEES